MKRPVIVLGCGGHARVLLEVLRLQSVEVLAIADPNWDSSICRSYGPGCKMLTSDDDVLYYPPGQVYLVNGLGSVDVGSRRWLVFQRFKSEGYTFMNVIHPSAIVPTNLLLGEGVQIMAGAVLQPGSKLGHNVLVNTGVIIDHDCSIGDHVHIAPGSVISGNVAIGRGTHVGTGAKIINNVSVGVNCTVGAGAVIIHDVPSNLRVAGVPAKVIGENQPKEV